MSAKISGKVWELELDPTEKLVLLALSDHADHEGNNVRPGNDLLVAKTGLSERTVGLKIAEFIQRGILEPENATTGRGRVREFTLDADRCERRQYFIERDKRKAERERARVEARSTDTAQKGRSTFDRYSTEGSKHVRPMENEKAEADAQKVEADAQKVEADGKTYKEHEPSIEPSIESSTPSAEPTKTSEVKSEKPKNPFCESFRLAYESAYSCPYQSKTADFVQLAACRKTGGEWLTPDRWQIAVGNYFASELGNHTLADLSARFGAFFRSRLDRFGKPSQSTVQARGFSGGINASNSSPEEFAAEVRRIHEAKYGQVIEMEVV
jgi:hypothetical protein